MQLPKWTQMIDLIHKLLEAGRVSVLLGSAKCIILHAIVASLQQRKIFDLAVGGSAI
jgi:hypothetical protein